MNENKQYLRRGMVGIGLILFMVMMAAPVAAADSQAPAIDWLKCIGGSELDKALCIEQTTDSGYIFCGISKSNDGDASGNHGDTDAWAVKTDAEGNPVWHTCLGGISFEDARDIHQTADGGYIVAGDVHSTDGEYTVNHGSTDAWVAKLNADGEVMWQKCIGGTCNEMIYRICQISDGGYIFAGETASVDGEMAGNHGEGSSQDGLVGKLDSEGNILWLTFLGGEGSDYLHGLCETSDNGYVVTGYARSTDEIFVSNLTSGFHGGDYDAWAVKLDSDGAVEWQNCFGGTSKEQFWDVVQAGDGGYVAVGYTSSNDDDVSGNYGKYDAWLTKFDSDGNILWQKCLGGTSNDYAYDLVATADGGYAFTGKVRSNDEIVSGNHGSYDIWVVKTDADGTLAWQKCIGGSGSDYGYSLLENADGSLTVAGFTKSTDEDITNNLGNGDAVLAKLGDGAVTPVVPVADFSTDKTAGAAPLAVRFTDLSTGEPTEWAWEFDGDGTVDATEQNPTYTYDMEGTYMVSLSVTNANGSDTITKDDYITVVGGLPPVPVPDASDTVMFQYNLHHTGVTTEAGPVTSPECAWYAHTGYMNTDPLIIDDMVVSACSGNLSVNNRITGECLWYTVTGNGGIVGAGSNLGPVCYGNGTIFFPESGEGAISAYNIRTGKQLWRVSGLGGKYAQTNTPVIYEDHRIYFGNWNGNPGYYCYYDNGTECWSHAGSGYYWAGAAIIGDSLVFGGEDKCLTSLDKTTGEVIEAISVTDTFPIPDGSNQVRSSVMYDKEGGYCYFTTSSGYCCGIGFDAPTGTFRTDDAIASAYIGQTTSTPAVYKGRLYVGVGRMYNKDDTFLYCLNATDLTQVWKFTANGIIQSSPKISTHYEDATGNIYLYFTTNIQDGTAYCVRDFAGNTEPVEAWHWTPPEGMREYVLAGAVIKDGYLYFGNNAAGGTTGCTFALTGGAAPTVPPTADFTADVTEGQTPLTVTFTDLSTDAETHAWDFDGDGTVDSTEANPVRTYTKAGTYAVSLTVTNGIGADTMTKTDYIVAEAVPELSVSLEMTDCLVNDTTTVDLVVDTLPDGLAGYNVTVSLSDASVAEITAVSFPDWTTISKSGEMPAGAVWIKAVDLNDAITAGAENVTIATLTLTGNADGAADITVSVTMMDSDDGCVVSPDCTAGTVFVSALAPMPGCTQSPHDLNSDGIHEDVNGNYRFDFDDVVTYYTNIEWMDVHDPVAPFDVNGNGRIDFADLVDLFNEL